MKMTCKAFAKNLFGAKYERLKRSIFIYLIVFWSLYITSWKMQIAPFIRYLMLSTFTAGVMWQALCSDDHAAKMKNMFMLPFDEKTFVFPMLPLWELTRFSQRPPHSLRSCLQSAHGSPQSFWDVRSA